MADILLRTVGADGVPTQESASQILVRTLLPLGDAAVTLIQALLDRPPQDEVRAALDAVAAGDADLAPLQRAVSEALAAAAAAQDIAAQGRRGRQRRHHRSARDRGGGVRLRASSTTIASAAAVDLGAAPTLKVIITGTVPISSFGAVPHALVFLRFADVLTLALPGAVSIVTAAGDTAIATSDASGTWTVRHYQRASGKPLAGPAAADIADSTATGGAAVTAANAVALATAAGLGTTSQPTVAGLTVNGTASATTVNAGTVQIAGDPILGSPDAFCRALMAYGQQIAAFSGSSDPTI